MEAYEQKLRIDNELFANMREDTDRVLQKLLRDMVEKDSLEGKVTIGIDVVLTQEFIPNRDPGIDGETRRALTPKFSHKVGSVMQIKNEAKGDRNCDGAELVLDEESNEYVLRPITNTEQMTIFDAEFRCINNPGGEANDGNSLPLEGTRVAALPESSGTDNGGKEMEDETEDMSDEFGINPSESDTMPEDFPFTDDGYGYEEPGME